MSNGNELSDEDWIDMIILITDRNGGSIDRGQLQRETGLNDDDLDDYVDTLHVRELVTFAHRRNGRTEDQAGRWMHIRLTEAGIERAREFDEE